MNTTSHNPQAVKPGYRFQHYGNTCTVQTVTVDVVIFTTSRSRRLHTAPLARFIERGF